MLSALGTGYWLPTRLAYVIFFGVPIAYFWAKANTRNLSVVVERPNDRLQEGSEFSERITVKNNGWFTKLWLEVEDPSDMPGYTGKQVRAYWCQDYQVGGWVHQTPRGHCVLGRS